MVNKQQHAQGVLIWLKASGGSTVKWRTRETEEVLSWLESPQIWDHCGGDRWPCSQSEYSPQDELAVLQCSTWASSLLQETHLLVEGQVEAPRSRTVTHELVTEKQQNMTTKKPSTVSTLWVETAFPEWLDIIVFVNIACMSGGNMCSLLFNYECT